ncbi:MAG: choice-of-anchor Q domain-containing protein [Bacteroidales bacterium]|nr:choice-of-anchor Q domain-containing protein [Bacteroidales bacterium]
MKTKSTKIQFALTFICFAISFFGIVNSIVATDYYIAPTGSNTTGNGSFNSPWKTIDYASAKLSPGQTLYARGGTYYGQAGYIWHSSGTSAAPITFKNYPGEIPVFDGEWGDTGTDGDFLVFSNNSWIVVDSITAQHYVDQYGNGTIDFNTTLGPVNNIIIQNCTLKDNGSHTAQDHHIYLAGGATNITIRNNLFIRGAGSAVQAYHTPAVSGIKIYNNVMIGGKLNCSQSVSNPCSSGATKTWGIIIGDAKDVEIYNNTIYGMQRGIDFNYGTSAAGSFIIKNNLIINSTEFGLRVTSMYVPYITSDNNGFYGNATDVVWNSSYWTLAQFKANTSNDHNSISANPVFVTSGSDFHLKSTSPAIDKGVTTTMFSTDFDYNIRPQGSGYDIGAYEYVISTSQQEIENAINVFAIYPNPFNTTFTLKISPEIIIKNALMKIYDVYGKEVKTILINTNETIIDRGELQSGIYFYQVINNNENIFKGKLVIQ